MKKLLILAIAATMGMTVMAQSTKKADAVKKKIERSDDAIADAKKQVKAATWIERGTIFTDAGVAYTSDLIANIPISQMTASDALAEANTIENVTLSGEALQKHVYDKIDVYTNTEGVILFWVVKEEAVPNAFAEALAAFAKAEELTPGTFAKETSKPGVAIQRLNSELNQAARNSYMIGEFAKAGVDFALAYDASVISGRIDTVALAYSGICYFEGGLFQESIDVNEKLLSIGGEQEGTTYYYLGSSYDKVGNSAKAISTLEEGFNKYPENSTVMSGLINTYMLNKEDPEKLIELIKKAQTLDPSNSSLYLVESQIWDNLGNRDNSYIALEKAIELDPQSMPAYYNYAVLKIISSDDVAKEADKLDINDTATYDKMLAEVQELRTASVRLLEKAHEIAPEDQNIVDILTQMYFVCRDYSDEFAAKSKEFTEKANQ